VSQLDRSLPATADPAGSESYLQHAHSFLRRDRLNLLALVAVTAATRLALSLALPSRVLSNDFRIWDTVTSVLLSGTNPYAVKAGLLYYPPLWMQVLFVLGELSSRTHIPLAHLIQLFLVGIDIVTVVVVYLFARALGIIGARAFWLALFGFAVNPISIILTCQHGNFDSVIGLSVVATAFALVVWNRQGVASTLLLACLILGIGILAKTVPLILAPFLAIRWRETDWPTRVVGATLVVGPTLLGVSIVYVLSPNQVIADIFQYRSAAGYFGITGLLNLIGSTSLVARYSSIYPVMGLALLIVASAAFARARETTDFTIIAGCVILLMSVPAFGSGYGPQYTAWFLPLAVILFGIGNRALRGGLGALYSIAIGTYLVEYAVIPSQGAFFSMFAPEQTAEWGRVLSPQKAQTLLRLPLFVAYLSFIGIGLQALRSRLGRGALQSSVPK